MKGPAGLLTPFRVVPMAFAAAIAVGTILLALPISSYDGEWHWMTGLFTSTSAVCVTGLTAVDTPTFWTPFGKVVIVCLIQLGGLGIMTAATVMLMGVGRRIGVRTALITQIDAHSMSIGDVRDVAKRIVVLALAFESAIAAVLFVRFWVTYDHDPLPALWHAVFHAVSSFNNAGFALYTDNIIGFADDPWIMLPLCFAVVIGGLGFPVLFVLITRARWGLLTQITLAGTTVLLTLGAIGFAFFEWDNPETLGPLNGMGKALTTLSLSVMPRTAGFNAIDYGQATDETLFLTDILMFIGGGSAGTAGGIKVTTFFLLGFVILSELQARPNVVVGTKAFGKRAIPASVQRQALTVALLGVGAVVSGTFALLVLTDYRFEQVLFEATSAFATVGLTTGITYDLGPLPQLVLIALMYVGRVGLVTLGAALAYSSKPLRYSVPEEPVIVG